jgi:plasmid stabilization system protein ParE
MKVEITENASKNYEKIFEYITAKFSFKEATEFALKTIEIKEMISRNPKIGSQHKKTPYRKFLISKQTYLFYKIEKEVVYITLFWDTNRNPLDLEIILHS